MTTEYRWPNMRLAEAECIAAYCETRLEFARRYGWSTTTEVKAARFSMHALAPGAAVLPDAEPSIGGGNVHAAPRDESIRRAREQRRRQPRGSVAAIRAEALSRPRKLLAWLLISGALLLIVIALTDFGRLAGVE